MKPSGVKTNPDPEPAGVSPRRTSTLTTDGLARPAASMTASEYASRRSLSGGWATGITKGSESIASSDKYAGSSLRQPAGADRKSGSGKGNFEIGRFHCISNPEIRNRKLDCGGHCQSNLPFRISGFEMQWNRPISKFSLPDLDFLYPASFSGTLVGHSSHRRLT